MAKTFFVNSGTFSTECEKFRLVTADNNTVFQASVEKEYFITISDDLLYFSDEVKDEVLSFDFYGGELSSSVHTRNCTTRTQISNALSKLHSNVSWDSENRLDTSDPKVKKCIAIACLRRAIPIIRQVFTKCPIDTSLMSDQDKDSFNKCDLISKLQDKIDKAGFSCEELLPQLIVN